MWVEVLPKRVLVHHLPTVLDQVEIVLADMQILPSGGGLGCDRPDGSSSDKSPDLAE